MTGTKKSTKPINKNTKSHSPKPKKQSKTRGQSSDSTNTQVSKAKTGTSASAKQSKVKSSSSPSLNQNRKPYQEELSRQETLKSLKKRSIETSESPNDGWVRANRSEQSNLRERGFVDSRKECLAVELSQKVISNLEKNAKKSGLSLSEFAEKTLRDAAKI